MQQAGKRLNNLDLELGDDRLRMGFSEYRFNSDTGSFDKFDLMPQEFEQVASCQEIPLIPAEYFIDSTDATFYQLTIELEK